jgi:hypothetical protein
LYGFTDMSTFFKWNKNTSQSIASGRNI